MDKVKKFLESYVEWVALALGAAFLGWMVYGYVLDKPVSSTVGSESGVEPADIPKKIWDGPGKTLRDAIDSTTAPPQMDPTVDYAVKLPAELSESSTAVNLTKNTPIFPLAPAIDDQLLPAQDTPGISNQKVAALPAVPKPIELNTSHGHSNVQPPNPASGAPAGGQVVAIDKNWIDFGASIPVAPMAKSIADAKIPPYISNVDIYRVVAVRQEKDAAGSWVNETEIPPLDINPLMPLPPVDCSADDRQAYKTWAEQQANVVLIAEPPFYTVLHGSIWYEPGARDPNETDTQMVIDIFDPHDPLGFKGDPNTLLPEEKKAYDEAVAKKARQDAAKNHTTPNNNTPQGYQPGNPGGPGAGGPGTGSSGRGGTGRGGGGRNAPDAPPANPGNLLMPPNYGGGPGGGYGGGPGSFQPGPGGFRPPGMDNSPQPSSVSSLPQGSFSPAERAAAAVAAGTDPNIKIWVHDVSVQAGKTYRYKIKYIISNPVAGTNNTCEHPEDAAKAYIESEWSDWSKEVAVESDTNFYAIDNKHGIRFDIFKWKNGVWQMQTVQANPGDRVGSLDNTPLHTDFDTGWTLVDVREDPGGNSENKLLILVSENGTVKQKEIAFDRQNPEYRKLLGEVMADRQKTASAGGGPSGPGPGVGAPPR